ncbi:MAG: response regulator [Geminicoccaceae bacterium]
MRVLLIDDDLYDRRALRRLMKRLSMDVSMEEAFDVASALQLLAVEAFDCLLIDYRLPDGDGIELVQKLMATNLGGPVPAIMLSGQPTDALAREAMENGLLDFLSKEGLNADMLERALRNALIKRDVSAKQKAGLAGDIRHAASKEMPSSLSTDDAKSAILTAMHALYQSDAIRAAVDLDAEAKQALDIIYDVANAEGTC